MAKQARAVRGDGGFHHDDGGRDGDGACDAWYDCHACGCPRVEACCFGLRFRRA
jgi:hypothetical protein